MKALIVVDMQKDFIDGTLANPAAEKIISNIVEKISNFKGEIIFTRDTHFKDVYSSTLEGRHLPVLHCVEGTDGWQVDKRLVEAAEKNSNCTFEFINKLTFGHTNWANHWDSKEGVDALHLSTKVPEEIEICGTVTSICVASNALILRAQFPLTEIYVDANCCADLSPEKQAAALEVMKSCQINVIE